MKKPTRDLIMDTLSFTSFSFLASSGLLIKFFPRQGVTIWGMNRHTWNEVHFWLALIFVGIILVHLAQHWKWIVSVVRGRLERHSKHRSVLALTLFAVIVAIAVAPFVSPVGR